MKHRERPMMPMYLLDFIIKVTNDTDSEPARGSIHHGSMISF